MSYWAPGGGAFIEPLHKRAPEDEVVGEIARIHDWPVANPLTGHEAFGRGDRDVAIVVAFQSGDYAMQQVVGDCGVRQSTVSRAVKR